MNKIACITGASSGFGKSIALTLAENGYDVIITARRNEMLLETEKLIRNKTKAEVHSLCFDVRNQDEVNEAVDSLLGKWKNIDVLVNNAGLAVGLHPVHEGVVDDWERMIDTNVKGLLYVTRKISPLMVAQRKGHIINIGSIAGREVYPSGNVYCGTKYAVDAISKGTRIDLVNFNIKVTVIHPGMAETEFSLVRFKGDAERAKKVYDNVVPLYAEDIAQAVLFVVTRPEHVNINEMVIMPTCQASAVVVNRNTN